MKRCRRWGGRNKGRVVSWKKLIFCPRAPNAGGKFTLRQKLSSVCTERNVHNLPVMTPEDEYLRAGLGTPQSGFDRSGRLAHHLVGKAEAAHPDI